MKIYGPRYELPANIPGGVDSLRAVVKTMVTCANYFLVLCSG